MNHWKQETRTKTVKRAFVNSFRAQENLLPMKAVLSVMVCASPFLVYTNEADQSSDSTNLLNHTSFWLAFLISLVITGPPQNCSWILNFWNRIPNHFYFAEGFLRNVSGNSLSRMSQREKVCCRIQLQLPLTRRVYLSIFEPFTWRLLLEWCPNTFIWFKTSMLCMRVQWYSVGDKKKQMLSA